MSFSTGLNLATSACLKHFNVNGHCTLANHWARLRTHVINSQNFKTFSEIINKLYGVVYFEESAIISSRKKQFIEQKQNA